MSFCYIVIEAYSKYIICVTLLYSSAQIVFISYHKITIFVKSCSKRRIPINVNDL